MPEIKPLAILTPPSSTRTWMSTPHPSLPIIATACSDKTVRIYSLQTFSQQATVSGGHKRSIRSCAWKPNSASESVLATGSFDASAGIWRRTEGTGAAGGRAREVDFTGGLAGGNDDDGEADDGDDEWRFAVILDGHDSEIKSLAFSPTSPLLATCSRDKSVWIWEELDDDNFETVAVLQEHEGDVKCVAWSPSEELLASGSYDDNVRLWREDVDDWACCALLAGHGGTVWWVEFEGGERSTMLLASEGLTEGQTKVLEEREKAGPRLISCSDDQTIRIWRRIPKDKPPAPPTGQGRMPSIFKNNDFEEDWVEEAHLPQAHERTVYAVSWSGKSGRVVSTGSDGKIIVYEERWKRDLDSIHRDSTTNGDTMMTDAADKPPQESTMSNNPLQSLGATEWVVLAEYENAHDVFEVNHVVWAARADNGRRSADEEVIVSTGDDGEVKVWTFDP